MGAHRTIRTPSGYRGVRPALPERQADAVRPSTLDTAATISSSDGNFHKLRSATTASPTVTWKIPLLPATSSGSTPSSFFKAAAARTARGLYPQELQ